MNNIIDSIVEFLAATPWILAIGSLVAILTLISIIANFVSKFDVILKPKIPIIVAIILILVNTIYLINKFSHLEKTNIALIVPLDASNDVVMDAERQVLGWAKLLIKYPEYSQKFYFSIHKATMDSASVDKIIKDELTINGTKYFVVTMSKHAIHISEEWKNIFLDIPEKEQPVIISTVASSPNINIIKNHFYRFYIRSHEEVDVLANKANDSNINKVSFIAVDDPYGHGAVESFKNKWKKGIEGGFYIKNGADKQVIKEEIRKNINLFKKQDGIFVAHYGNGIDSIITSLDELSINKVIIATSTITIPAWRKPIDAILKRNGWITSIPKINKDKYQNDDISSLDKKSFNIYSGDVVHDFIYYSFDRLITTINTMSTDKTLSFDAAWTSSKNKIPNDVLFGFDENGDSTIEMESISGDIK